MNHPLQGLIDIIDSKPHDSMPIGTLSIRRQTENTAPTEISLLKETDSLVIITGSQVSPSPAARSPAVPGIMPDFWIREKASLDDMINPFEPEQVKERDGKKLLSYGTSSFGYDIRCAPVFYVFTNINSTLVDPKNFNEKNFVKVEGDEIIIPPNSFILGHSLEYLKVPDDVLVVVLGKSTLARCGCNVLATPLEPGWEGHITMEFANTTPLPMKFYANEGCAQLLFLHGSRPDQTYRDRGGKYQKQQGITLPKT